MQVTRGSHRISCFKSSPLRRCTSSSIPSLIEVNLEGRQRCAAAATGTAWSHEHRCAYFEPEYALQAVSELMGAMPANVHSAVLSNYGGFQRHEEILARHEQLLSMYESRICGAQGGKQFSVPNLFVDGATVAEGCPANEVPVSAADGTAVDWQRMHVLKPSSTKGKGTPVEPSAAPGKEVSLLRGDGQSQDTSLQPEVTNSQLQFLQCLQNSQDCPMGASQENLFPWSQPTLGASDPLLSCTPLSQGPWGGAQASDVGAGATTSQLLASQPASTAPDAGENEGGQ